MPDSTTPIGFCAASEETGVAFRFYAPPGDGPLDLLTFEQTPACAVAVLGRIYYREDALARARTATEPALLEKARTSDAALALAVYLGGGAEAIAELEGDFSLVLFDAQRQQLIGLRDPMGGYPLFWVENGKRIAMSPCMRPLADLLPEIRIDPRYLAQYLMLPACSFEEVTEEVCAIAGIQRVLPGTMLVADLRTRRFERRTTFDWIDRITRQETSSHSIKTSAEAGQAYRDCLREAVAQRMRGRVAAHLSGGMDSTTIALLAAQLSDEGHGDGAVDGWSLVYSRLGVLARETPRVRSVQQAHPRLKPYELDGDSVLDFDGFDDPPPHDEPWPWLPRIALNSILTEPASEAGARTVMSGIGADEVLDIPPVHISDLLRRGRLIAAWREASRWAAAQPCSRWSILRPFGIKPLYPAWAQDGLGALFRGGRGSMKNIGNSTVPPWILPAFGRQHQLRSIGLAHYRRINRGCNPSSRSLALAAVHARRGEITRRYIALPRGTHEAHPFLDPRVTCFAMSLRPEVVFVPGARKAVLSEATVGILPEELRTRQRKGHFNEVYFLGLSKHLPELEDLVHSAPVDDLQFLDRSVLLECLQRTALGTDASGGVLDRLNLTLALLKWISMLPEWKQATWTPLNTVEITAPAVHQ